MRKGALHRAGAAAGSAAQALSLRRSRVTWEKRIGIGDPPSLPVTTPLGTGVPGQGISLAACGDSGQEFVFQALNVNLAAARRAQVDGRSSASSGAFDVARGASRHTPGARACACRLRRASSLPIFFFGCPLPDAENPPLLSRASTTQDPQCLAVVGILSNLSSWHLSNVMVIVFK